MESIKFTGVVMAVVPKHGRSDVIKLVIETPYNNETLLSLADAMMTSNQEDSVEVLIEYEPMPLFEDDQEELDLEV